MLQRNNNLATVTDKLAAAVSINHWASQPEPTRCSENHIRCGECSQCQGLISPSLLVAARITLIVENAIKYSEHNFPKVSHYSLTEPPRCNEIHYRCSECSQHQKLTRPSLLVTASCSLIAMSAFNTRGSTTRAYSLHQSPISL